MIFCGVLADILKSPQEPIKLNGVVLRCRGERWRLCREEERGRESALEGERGERARGSDQGREEAGGGREGESRARGGEGERRARKVRGGDMRGIWERYGRDRVKTG